MIGDCFKQDYQTFFAFQLLKAINHENNPKIIYTVHMNYFY